VEHIPVRLFEVTASSAAGQRQLNGRRRKEIAAVELLLLEPQERGGNVATVTLLYD
jgi:hypothetical protein